MKLSVDRLKGFSDALIAIVITLMILEVPIPESADPEEIFEFIKGLLIFACGFSIVGFQWLQNIRLLDGMKTCSMKFVKANLFYLFLLCMMPLLMKWVIINPGQTFAALGYSLVYILESSIARYILHIRIREKYEDSLPPTSWQHWVGMSIGLVIALLFVSIQPTFSAICLIAIPAVFCWITPRPKKRNIRTHQNPSEKKTSSN